MLKLAILTYLGVFIATYYSDWFEGRRTASGKIFTNNSNYIAMNNVKFGTKVRIEHNGRSVIGVVEDRCSCEIDLSKTLFSRLANLSNGVIKVKVYIERK